MFSIDKFVECLHEQTTLALKHSLFFAGTTEISQPGTSSLEDEIDAAEHRDPWTNNSGHYNLRPTLYASLEVGEGIGRATREVEIIWWPDLYKSSYHGQLTLRFFLNKCSL